MDCRYVRHHLPALVCGDLPVGTRAEVRRHLSTCGPCHRAWVVLDPVGATQAFGAPQPAPLGLEAAVMAEIRRLPQPSRQPSRADTAMLAMSGAGILVLWLAFALMRPLTAAVLATALRMLATATAVAATLLSVTLQIVHPALPLVAGLVVIAELALVGRWVRPT